MKSKVDKLDVHKLVTVPVDLSKLSDVVKNDVFKKDVYNAKTKNIEYKIPDITYLATNTSLNAKINEVKGEKPNITNLASTTVLTIKRYSIHNEGKSVVAERFIRILNNKIYKYMTTISKNMCTDKLDDILNKDNNTYHRTIGQLK